MNDTEVVRYAEREAGACILLPTRSSSVGEGGCAGVRIERQVQGVVLLPEAAVSSTQDDDMHTYCGGRAGDTQAIVELKEEVRQNDGNDNIHNKKHQKRFSRWDRESSGTDVWQGRSDNEYKEGEKSCGKSVRSRSWSKVYTAPRKMVVWTDVRFCFVVNVLCVPAHLGSS